MIKGLVDHVERHLGEIAGEWDADPEGNPLPFGIVHYAPAADDERGIEVFSTLGMSDYPLGERGVRVELLMIGRYGMTAGSIPPILHHAGMMPIDADDVPQLGDVYTDVESLREVSPMDMLYVGRPLYQRPEFSPFDNGVARVHFLWLIPIHDVEADFIEDRGWQEFEQLMWDLDVDPTDYVRDDWIDNPQ